MSIKEIGDSELSVDLGVKFAETGVPKLIKNLGDNVTDRSGKWISRFNMELGIVLLCLTELDFGTCAHSQSL
jgi:hypothetical protein